MQKKSLHHPDHPKHKRVTKAVGRAAIRKAHEPRRSVRKAKKAQRRVAAKNSKLPNIKLTLVLVATCLVVGLGTAVVVVGLSYNREHWLNSLGIGKRVVFKIGDKSYRQTEVKQSVGYLTNTVGLALEQAERSLFEALKLQTAGVELGIIPTEAEVTQAGKILALSPDSDETSTYWASLANHNLALSLAAKRLGVGAYQGYSFIFYFGQRIEKNPDVVVTGFGNKALIAASRAYSEGQAKRYRVLLEAKQMTPEAVIEAIKKDGRLGYNNLPQANFSVRFGMNPAKDWRKEVYYSSVSDFINKQTKTGLSGTQVGKTAQVPLPKSDTDYVETFYYFTFLDKADQPRPNLEKRLQERKDQIKSKFYGSS